MTEALRARMAHVFESVGGKQGRAFASELRGDEDGGAPCWGEIADAFEGTFQSDDARLSVLELLVAEGNPAALLLFLDASRPRPRVLAAMLAAAPRLSGPLQRSVIAVVRAEDTLVAEAELSALHPSAREMAEAPEAELARELAVFTGRVRALRALRVRAARQSHGPHAG